MHPLLQDFLAVVMDTMTMHINPQYKHITMIYWSARLSCCLQKSIAKSLSRKYSASNGLAAKGIHFSHPHRELSIERDLTLLSIGVAVCVWETETMIVMYRMTTCWYMIYNIYYIYIIIYMLHTASYRVSSDRSIYYIDGYTLYTFPICLMICVYSCI